MQKNQERRLQRKNAAIIKEGGAPIVLDRAPKPDTSVSTPFHLIPRTNSSKTEALWALWSNWSYE
jgi:hypothetical protein